MTTYTAASDRYSQTPTRRCGHSGVVLPPISLGIWRNFGHDRPFSVQRDIVLRAFDLGVFHIDAANNYGPPYGAAEENLGRLLATDLKPHRDELIISSKAGFDMWDGPYGDGGSRKYLLASLDQSLARLGLDYVDIFYHHRRDPSVPIEESMSALITAVHSGRALYVGLSNYGPEDTLAASEILRSAGVRLLIHQPRYSMFDRRPEHGQFDVLEGLDLGAAVYSPLAQGLLTNRYLGGVPAESRAGRKDTLAASTAQNETYLHRARGLQEIADARGQTLAQMALAWVLRQKRVTTALVGASSVGQLEDTLATAQRLDFGDDELSRIDEFAVHGTDGGWG